MIHVPYTRAPAPCTFEWVHSASDGAKIARTRKTVTLCCLAAGDDIRCGAWQKIELAQLDIVWSYR